ncbi:MAG TPA: hypothetical protein VMT58_08540, partial [Candidatus Binataceae bacterium]|nr:hypothetical protein [Candidatus Binataceae bacterium]
SQSAPHAFPTARFSRRSKQRFSETVKGRIVKLDVNAGTFSVQIGATNRVIDLEAADGVRLTRLRRGERVIVTYSGSVATKVEATRSEK